MEKLDAVYEMNAGIGYALWQCQALENTLIYYIILKYRIKRGAPSAVAESAFKSVQKLTLGNLLADIRNQPDAPASLVDRLTAFLGERNWLVHRCFTENQGVANSLTRLNALLSRCGAMSDKALSLNKEFAALLEAAVLTSVVSKEELDSQAAKLIAEWSEE